MASVVLDNLAAGVGIDELLESYPSLTRDGVLAAMAYAADLARDRTVDLTSTGPTSARPKNAPLSHSTWTSPTSAPIHPTAIPG